MIHKKLLQFYGYYSIKTYYNPYIASITASNAPREKCLIFY